MSTLKRAIEIAKKAHEGQVDKASEPYINHPLRVMARVTTQEEKIVASPISMKQNQPELSEYSIRSCSICGPDKTRSTLVIAKPMSYKVPITVRQIWISCCASQSPCTGGAGVPSNGAAASR